MESDLPGEPLDRTDQIVPPAATPVTFGLKTSPSQVAYADILRVWREADLIPEIAHAWLFDHLCRSTARCPAPCSKAGRCSPRSRRTRPSRPRSDRHEQPVPPPRCSPRSPPRSTSSRAADSRWGSASEAPGHPIARREYDAYGIPFISPRDAVDSLDEACTIISRLWTENEPFDFDGAHHHLRAAHCNPKPVQDPGHQS